MFNLNSKLIFIKPYLDQFGHMAITIWGPTKPSNIRSTQAFQSIGFRIMTGASWYITNESLHKDFKMSTINGLAKTHY